MENHYSRIEKTCNYVGPRLQPPRYLIPHWAGPCEKYLFLWKQNDTKFHRVPQSWSDVQSEAATCIPSGSRFVSYYHASHRAPAAQLANYTIHPRPLSSVMPARMAHAMA